MWQNATFHAQLYYLAVDYLSIFPQFHIFYKKHPKFCSIVSKVGFGYTKTLFSLYRARHTKMLKINIAVT